MKKQEKIELKKMLLPVIPSLFERDKKEFFASYPFLEIADDEIEDDPEIFDKEIEINTFIDREQYSGLIKTEHTEIKIINSHRAIGDECGHGIYLDYRNNWVIRQDAGGSGFNLVCYYTNEQRDQLKKLGYESLKQLVYR